MRVAMMAGVAALALLAPGVAWANCDLTPPDVICDGATGPNTTAVVTGKRSVTFRNGQTQGTATGLTVNGDATNGANITLDLGTSITASQPATYNAATLQAYAALTVGGVGLGATASINGDLTSTSYYGLDASTTTSASLIDIRQGATSTIRGSNYALGGFNWVFEALHTRAIGGGNTRIVTGGTLIGGIFAESGDGNGIGGGAASFQITNNGTIRDLPGVESAGIRVNQTGTGNIDVINNGAILTTFYGVVVGDFLPTGATSAGNATVTVNADIGSAAIRPRFAVAVQVGNDNSTGDARIVLNNASVYGYLTNQSNTRGTVSIIGTGTGTIFDGAFGTGLVTANNFLEKGPGNVVVDLTQTIDITSPSNESGYAGILASTKGTGAVSVNRTSGGGNITVLQGSGISIGIDNGVGLAAPVGPFVALSATQNTNRLVNNSGTLAVTVGTGRTISAAQGDGIRLFSGYSTGSAVVDVNGRIATGFVGVWGRGTRNDFSVAVASSGSIAAATGIELTTAADYINPQRSPTDSGDPTVYQLNITPTVSGLQLGGILTVNNAGNLTGTSTGVRLVSGGTGTAVVTNSGTLVGGTNAVTGSTAGNAFRIANSGTMTGAVNVTGSAVATSQLTNSGTWNLGTGNSAFSGNVSNNGTLNMAGGAANTLTVIGNLVFNAGSVLRVDIGSTQATTDRIIVTGTATLAGAVNALPTSGNFTAGTYNILTANGGVSGTFSPLTTQPNAQARLTYDANNVFLVLDATTGFTASTSTSQRVVLNAATVTTNTTNAFSTRIVGRIEGGSPLYDQSFAAPFAGTAVQNGVTAARAAITTVGGPGVIIGAPVRTASATSSVTTTGATTYALASMTAITTAEVVVGPGTTTTGPRTVCTGIGALPTTVLPTCGTGNPITTTIIAGQINTNTNVETTYTLNQSRTDTVASTLNETYELNGQVVAVGSVHAEVQSGLFDLGGRLLGRLGRVEAGSAGWADVYGFRVNQGARRAALGIAGGVGIGVAPGLTLALGIDRGRIDMDIASALETGRVELTEIGGALRYDNGPFAASLALVQGFGNASTRRAIFGSSSARYDVRVTGVAFDLSYAIATGGWTLRPEAGIDWVRVSTSGFTETDTLGLVVAGGAARQVRATAGLSVGRDFGLFGLSARARYLAVLEGLARSVPVAFALSPTRPLTMSSAGEPGGALIGARLGVPLGARATFSAGYDARLGGGYTSHTATASVRVTF